MTEAEKNEKTMAIQFIWGEIRAPKNVSNQQQRANTTQEQALTTGSYEKTYLTPREADEEDGWQSTTQRPNAIEL